MTTSNLPALLRQLAAEPARDATDPWPAIRRQLVARAERDQRAGRGRRVPRLSRRPLMTAAAAVVVVGLSVGVALFVNRPPEARAAEVLHQVEAEAFMVSRAGPGSCQPANADARTTGDVIAFGAGQQADGPVTVSSADATQLSDKLAQALGVSGDRVRQAMRQTLSPELPPSPPPDPMATIARQLGVSTDQVCAAFFNPQAPSRLEYSSAGNADSKLAQQAAISLNGTVINLNNLTAAQLSGPARKLGVSPERLLAAVKAAVPPPPPLPPAPPSEDELITRFAQNLGMSPDKVRAAITQVEGPNRLYFAVPLPGFAGGASGG